MLILIIGAAFLSSFLTLFSGFGLGTILMPVFALFFPIELAIALTKKEYFLGENMLLHYCLENAGKQPFRIEVGGDYRGD